MRQVLFFLVLIFLAASCSTFRQGNFNKQKFTRLKPIESSNEVNAIDATKNNTEIPAEFTYENYVSDDTSGCDSIWLSNGEIYVCTILEETKESVTFTRCPPDSSEFKLDQRHILEIKTNEISDRSVEKNEKRDTTISEDPYTSYQKEQLANKGAAETNRNSNAEKWNRTFFIALTIFLIGLVFLLLSMIIGFLAFPAIALLVLAWFFSIYLCATSSRHSSRFDKKEVKGYGIKITLSVLYLFAPLIFFVACIALLLILFAAF